jgi:hypothetical protein
VQSTRSGYDEYVTVIRAASLARHRDITLTTDVAIFCDPHKPWQRGSNENTRGLLRQYFPKSTELRGHTPERLLEIAVDTPTPTPTPSTTPTPPATRPGLRMRCGHSAMRSNW